MAIPTADEVCGDTVGPIWKLDGETCVCHLPPAHVFERAVDTNGLDRRAHQCTCGSSWYDIQQLTDAGILQ